MTTFPNYIEIDLSGYSEEYQSQLLRSEFENGVAKQRPRGCRTRKLINFTGFVCSLENYKKFTKWWREDINQGSDWFLFTDPVTAETTRVRMPAVNVQSSPINTRANSNMQHWNISFQLEVWSA